MCIRDRVYGDHAATSQKPRRVIKAESAFDAMINANVHRGVHTLSTKATEAQEAAREIVRRHINAKHTHEVIFTSGTTAGLNLAAFSLCLLYTSDAADERSSVDLGGRRIIKKNTKKTKTKNKKREK